MGQLEDIQDLTFAVEMKFLIPYLLLGEEDPDDLVSPPIMRLRRKCTYEEQCLAVFTHVAGTITGSTTQHAVTLHEIQQGLKEEKSYWKSSWIVKKSNSAEPVYCDPQYSKYSWTPVEVNSPRFAWTDPKAMATISKILRCLKQNYRIVSNHTCEVHVHVGRRDGQEFSLSTLKRLATMTWLTEPVLRAVKDPRSPNFHHVHTWSSPLTEHSRLAAAVDDATPCEWTTSRHDDAILTSLLREEPSLDFRNLRALRRIWACESSDELARLLTGDERPFRRLGFNFSAFGDGDEHYPNSPKTMECRFLEGVMKSVMVVGWITLVCTLVEITLDGEQPNYRFKSIVSRLLQTASSTSKDRAFQLLCQGLKLPEAYSQPYVAKIRWEHGLSLEEPAEVPILWSQD